MLFSNIEEFRDRVCLLEESGEQWTYADLISRAAAIYEGLPKVRMLVFVVGGNGLATMAAYLGAVLGGHVVHVMDPSKVEENARLVRTYGPNVVLTCSGHECSAEVVKSSPSGLHPDLAALYSTSGSTGTSKFVKLSGRNLEANTNSIVEYLKLTKDDRGITSLKPFYSYGCSVINTHFAVGASLVLTERSVQDSAFWDAMRRFRVTNLAGVPHTFQVMRSMDVDLATLPDLRFMTQAGGKLSSNQVSHFAARARETGKEFFVMYGQTEAAPRISYLPPDMAERYPNSIGRAVPGGELYIVDERGSRIEDEGVEGELAYRGPNVMIGYAYSGDELGTAEQIEELRTGDLAVRNSGGLFEITGRRSRIVKPFGLRVNLDEVESIVSAEAGPSAVVGTDEAITVVVEAQRDVTSVRSLLAKRTGLPESYFRFSTGTPIPRLASGKTDYRSLASPGSPKARARRSGFFGKLVQQFTEIITGTTRRPDSVEAAFRSIFLSSDIRPTSRFVDLPGDSLSYLQLAMLLEDYLGDHLPPDWRDLTVAEIERRGARGV